MDVNLLPGIPRDRVLEALARAPGREVESGKLKSPESSAALAVNTFGWFLERPADLPPFPPLYELDWPATRVEVERTMRFPWSGGRHPWLDAAVETRTHLIGVESKRYEPYRDAKTVSLSAAYDRDVWGSRMGSFQTMRDGLRSGATSFECLDAAQLVKHAFGLVTEGTKTGLIPLLLYLYAEPRTRSGKSIDPHLFEVHRAEIRQFADAVAGSTVRFAACSYREWLATWSGDVQTHASAVIASFGP